MWCECFPEPLEIIVLTDQGIKGILGIIFGKLWIVGIENKGFQGHLGKSWIWESTMCVGGQTVCLADATMSRRHHALLGQKALVGTCVPTSSLEKKARLLSHDVSLELKKSFSLVSGMRELHFLPESPGEIVIYLFIYFISGLFYFFTFYVIGVFFSFFFLI